ncbi:MAG: hypothetical protein JF609_09860, partial [Verrucomicrobia bacterium]|nr:hypothetical protein [Verrucomicrobiota bacterium]
MKTKKLFSITSAIAGVLLAGSTLGALAQTAIYVDNASFELPATGKIGGGWDVAGANDVPGWHDMGAAPSDSGIENSGSGHSGSWGAYCQGGGAAGAYQITTNTMTWGKKYTLTWWAGSDYLPSDSPQRVAILSAAATNTPFGSCTEESINNSTVPSFSAYVQYTQTFIAGNAQVGKYIGMDFGNAVGFGWMLFDDFALTEEDASPAELQVNITTQPVGVTIYQDVPTTPTVVLTVGATGPDLAYQWKAGAVGSGIFTNVPNATNSALSILNAQVSADYKVTITNPSNSVTSDIATLTVIPATYVNGLFNGDFELPGTGKINAGFDVAGNDVVGWRNAGTNQNDTGIEGSGQGNNGTWGAYLHRGQDGAFQISTNVLHLGDSVTLTWYEADDFAGVNRKVSLLSASSQSAAFGSTTILAANTNEVTGGWSQKTLTYTAGAGDVGKFLGVAFQSADPATALGWANFDDFSIVITPPDAAPFIATQPASQTVWLAGTATFTVGAGGSGLSYQWQTGAVGSGIYTNISNGGQFSGANTATLTISNVAVENGLDYVVTVSNTGGSTNSNPATLTVDTSAPLITTQPVSAARATTESVSFSVGTTGGVSYQWKAGAVGSGIYTNLSNGGQFSGVNSATLTITNLQVANQADYVVVVSNGAGAVTSDPATLTVTPLIYLENFTANGPTISGIGWLADSRSGMYVDFYYGGTALSAYDSHEVPAGTQAFYTTTKLDNGSTGMAFPVINLTNVTGLSFSVDTADVYQGANTHMYWAVQMNGGQWYVSTAEIAHNSSSTLTVDTNAAAWNDLTVSGTGGTNTTLVPLIGSTSTNGLTGYMTGIGFATTTTGGSWVTIDRLAITGNGFT